MNAPEPISHLIEERRQATMELQTIRSNIVQAIRAYRSTT